VSIPQSECELKTIPGTTLKLLFQKGIPAIILPAFMADLNEFVEPVYNSRGYNDEGTWTNGNSVKSSNHLGATAFDYNWSDHPMGPEASDPKAGWKGSTIIKGDQVPAIRELLKFYNYKGIQLVFWGNDWNSPKDSMHFQMGYNTYENQVICWEFINKFIRPDGFSTYRRGGVPIGGGPSQPSEVPKVDLTRLVADAFGNVVGVDYAALTPYVIDCLKKSNCTNNNRIAMWFAQIGHESVGLRYMKEIGDAAYFAKYNNRSDLGNGPTDGPRYPGRGPIQVTGRNNYRKLSEWAHSKGYVPTPTYFEDSPEQLEKWEYAFLGAIWYWTVARPDINSLCDAGDLETVTRRINGGTNGIEDRRNRWNRCKTMNLMPLVEGGGEDSWLDMPSNAEKLDFIYTELKKRGPSRAGVAENGNQIETLLGYIYNIDGNVWDDRVIGLPYLLDVPYAVEQVERIASEGVAPDSYAAGNEFVAKFARDVCKALVEFKPKFKAMFDTPTKTTAKKTTTKKKAVEQ
jgi:predicted chitinase